MQALGNGIHNLTADVANEAGELLRSGRLTVEIDPLAIDPPASFVINTTELTKGGSGRKQVFVGVDPNDVTTLTFTDQNWNIPQPVFVKAVDDTLRDGGDAQSFPAFEDRIANIRGPLTIKGGIRTSDDRFLDDPVHAAG